MEKLRVVVLVRQKEVMAFFEKNFPGLTGKYQREFKKNKILIETETIIVPASIKERNGRGEKGVLFVKLPSENASNISNIIANIAGVTDVFVASKPQIHLLHQNLFYPFALPPLEKASSRRYRRYWHISSAHCSGMWGIVVDFNDKFMKEFVAVIYNIEEEKKLGGKLYAAKKRA